MFIYSSFNQFKRTNTMEPLLVIIVKPSLTPTHIYICIDFTFYLKTIHIL